MARSAADRKAEAEVYRKRSEEAAARAATPSLPNIQIGSNVRWTSAAGTKEGIVKNLYLANAADNKLHSWITIEFATPRGTTTTTFEASAGNLKAMRVEVIEPANTITVKNLMSGKPVTIDADTPWCCNPASEAYWSM